jgi:hypothetical protein
LADSGERIMKPATIACARRDSKPSGASASARAERRVADWRRSSDMSHER